MDKLFENIDRALLFVVRPGLLRDGVGGGERAAADGRPHLPLPGPPHHSQQKSRYFYKSLIYDAGLTLPSEWASCFVMNGAHASSNGCHA